MAFYLQTRGRTNDYAFLGDMPSDHWWTKYREFTAFEDPTILVHSDGPTWKVCLSGIPSSRKDRVGTTIRYTLVLEGSQSEERSCSAAYESVATWLSDVANAGSQNTLQRELDSEFPEEFVEQTIIRHDSKPFGGDIANKIEKALLGLLKRPNAIEKEPSISPNNEEAGHLSWVGALEKPRPRKIFLKRVQGLLNGQVGRALIMNLVESVDEARTIVYQGLPAVVLIEYSAKEIGHNILPFIEKKKIQKQTIY